MTSTSTSPEAGEAISSAMAMPLTSTPAEARDPASIIRHHLRRRLEEENVVAEKGNDVGGSDSGGGGDGGIPLSGEFFLMFFYVLLIVFAVLFLPVFWKCIKNVLLRRKVGLSNGDEEDCSTERTKEDILAGVAEIKEKIAEESRKVRYGMSNNSSNNNADDSATQNEEDEDDDQQQMSQNKRNDSKRPISGTFYGTYYYNSKARMTPMDLTFAPHPHGGFVILGSGQVQSGETELSEGYLAPNGEAYFVEVGGINPISVNLDVTNDELTSRRLAESVTSLYRGKFDFNKPNIIFKGWRYSSTGITRIYHLLRRPKESKIRHVMSTIGSSIHSAGRRRSSTTQQPADEEETNDEEIGGVPEATVEWTGQHQRSFPCVSNGSTGDVPII
uniref:Uncharacterized protein n=1 Tax=Minutocellus polymorphus TaxID=265543 RepID=A0A7S0FR11_9STRA|mmetsp:Transcript_4549/g.7766  ORF Transcript_4549/g.7766 Transcript_4549/m.7766 type:complete len:388 (+) Transcript_4549:171-1334(+)